MEISNLLEIARRAAVEAGMEIMKIYEHPEQDFGIELKADQSPLTKADRAAHACIVRHLESTRIPILSEEGAHLPYETRKAWDRLWIVDPLDGTKEFIKRNGDFTVNIALVVKGTPHMGVIYVPVKKELFYGVVGENAFKTTVDSQGGFTAPQPLPLPQERSHFVVVASRSHMSPETEAYIERLKSTHGEVSLMSRGSSLKICMVAQGTADSYPRFAPTMEWDTAAGDAIARAAGCQVTDALRHTPLCYNKEDLHNPWFLVERPSHTQFT